MLRELRAADIPQLLPLLDEHFPEEQRLLGWRPAVFERIVRELYRWHVRFLLGLLSVVGRPVYRFYVLDAQGQIAATTLLTYQARAGFVSMVMVDTPFRRRGYARQLLEAATVETRRRHRPYLVLEVLVSNAPARQLYDSAGFRPLQRKEYWVREPSAGGPPPLAGSSELRDLRRADRAPVLALAAAALPPAVAEVLPAEPGQMFMTRSVVAGLGAESKTWVAPREGAPSGFIRATVSEAMEAGHLSCPILASSLPDATADQLVAAACAWIGSGGPRRILAEVPVEDHRAREVLSRAGFRVAFALDTLVRTL